MVDIVESIFWENGSKLFKSKFIHRKVFGKWFPRYLQLKNECSECLKKAFSSFLQFLSDEVETAFWESETEPLRPIKFKVGHKKLFRKWFSSDLEVKNKYSKHLER